MSTSVWNAAPASAIVAVWYHRGVTDVDDLNENFARLVLHLGQMAAVYFGDLGGPNGEHMDPDLAAAGQVIEILGALQEKTTGNLSAAEAKILEDLLYDLRLRYVDAQQNGGRRIIEP